MEKSKELFRPLTNFYYGSLLVIMIALGAGAFFLASSFIQNEQKRASISSLQVEQSLETEHRYIVEEFFTSSYESIFIRVSHSLQKFGSPKFELYLYNNEGQCLLAKSEKDLEIPCKTNISADEGQLFYKSDLKLGSTRLGTIKVLIEDRFQFFTGSILRYAFVNYLPILLLVPLLWIVWALFSRKYILIPFYRQMMALEKEKVSTDIIRQIIHDTKGEIAFLDLALCELDDREKAEEMKQTLNHIRESFSNLSHHKEGIVTTVREVPLKANDLFNDFIEQQKIKYKKHSPQVIIESSSKIDFDHKVKVDSNTFYRVLSNLVENSVTAPNSEKVIRLKINFTETKDKTIFSIEDNGDGISEEIKDKLFIKGFTTKKTGTGQGLAYIQEVVKGWKGKISFETKIINGRGTIFNIEIPAYLKPKVVILDDATKLLYRYKKIVERFGHQTETFEDIPSLLNRSETFDSDTIFLLDFNLSDNSNGGEVAKKLHHLGMKNVYLHSGNPSLSHEDYPFVKGILSKGNFMETIALVGIC